jgi:hypothetical protein
MKRKPLISLWFKRPLAPPWWAYAALLAAAAGLSYASERYVKALDDQALEQAQLLDAQRQLRSSGKLRVINQTPVNPAQAKALDEMQHALAYDWNTIFSEIEQGTKASGPLLAFGHVSQKPTISVVLESAPATTDTSNAAFGLPPHWRIVEVSTVKTDLGPKSKMTIQVNSHQ